VNILDQLAELDRPEVEKRPWMEEVTMELVTTKSLPRVINECIKAKVYAWDVETTGLDTRVFWDEEGRPFMREKIVGHCLSPDGKRGYYLPLRHVDEHGDLHEANVPVSKANRELRRLAASDAVAIFHHSKFDTEFLQFAEAEPLGEWDHPDEYEDTEVLAYLRNTRDRRRGLKFLSQQELDMEMIELEDLFSAEQKKKLRGNLNFSYLDPTWEPCIWYGCSDAICTRLLFDKLHAPVMDPEPTGTSQKIVYQLEKMCLPATRWMERCRIHVNREKVVELIALGQAEWFESLEAVYEEASKILGRDVRPGWYRLMRGTEDVPGAASYRFNTQEMTPDYMGVRDEAKIGARIHKLDPMEIAPTGKERIRSVVKEVPALANPRKEERVPFPVVYDVTIPAQLGAMLREMGVKGLKATEKSGQVKTDQKTLDYIIETAAKQFPFMKKVQRFRQTKTALSNNLFPIYRDSDPTRSPDGCLQIGFNGHKVETGRFSTPKPRRKEFTGQARWNLHSIPATYEKDRPECMLRIRECVSARPGPIKRRVYAIDYAGVELRIVTNISREPKWLDEFFRCSGCDHRFDRSECPPPFCPKCGSDKIGDLHSLTAFAVYGEGIRGTKEFKGKRQKAKALNFAMCYGGGGNAAMAAVDVDQGEGWRIKRQFDASYTGLQDWWERQKRFVRKYKFVNTALGRRYQLPDIDHDMKGFRSKAERNAINGPVQGTSADITKLAMALVYRLCKKRGWLQKVLMTITIHDELVFEIDDDIAEEAVDAIVETMTRNSALLGLKHPIFYRCDIEFGDDWSVPNNLTEMSYNAENDKTKHLPGGGYWTPELVSVFPKAYLSFLEHGGTPVDGIDVDTLPEAANAPEASEASEAPEAPEADGDNGEPAPAAETTPPGKRFEQPETGRGVVVTHVIHSSRLTFGLMDSLARLIHRVEGSGLETLRVVTESGEVLWEDDSVTVSSTLFKVLAEEYRV